MLLSRPKHNKIKERLICVLGCVTTGRHQKSMGGPFFMNTNKNRYIHFYDFFNSKRIQPLSSVDPSQWAGDDSANDFFRDALRVMAAANATNAADSPYDGVSFPYTETIVLPSELTNWCTFEPKKGEYFNRYCYRYKVQRLGDIVDRIEVTGGCGDTGVSDFDIRFTIGGAPYEPQDITEFLIATAKHHDMNIEFILKEPCLPTVPSIRAKDPPAFPLSSRYQFQFTCRYFVMNDATRSTLAEKKFMTTKHVYLQGMCCEHSMGDQWAEYVALSNETADLQEQVIQEVGRLTAATDANTSTSENEHENTNTNTTDAQCVTPLNTV